MFFGECCLLFLYIFLVCQSYLGFDDLRFMLTELCCELLLEGLEQFSHNSLDLLVLEGILCVLEDEGECVALLASLEVLALIDIEESDLLEQFLLNSYSRSSEVGKLN